jgi:methionyl aminopeptidase
MWEEPHIPNWGEAGKGVKLRPGMVFALEPMVMLGSPETRVLTDHWTVVTADAKWCAHFEHTVAVTENGPEILTKMD